MEKLHITVVIDPQYNHKTKPNKKGEYPIHIRLLKGRQKESIIPDVPNIPLDQFKNGKGKWVQNSHRQARQINNKLTQVVIILEDYILNHDSRILTPKEVKGWYLRNHTKQGDFKDFRSQTLASYFEKKFPKTKKSQSTLVQYQRALKYLEDFKPEVRFLDFDRKFVENLADYFGSHSKLSPNSGAIYFDKIKAVYIKWYGENFRDDPAGYDRLFKKVAVKKVKSKPNRGFTQSELDAFIALDLTGDSRSELVRDLMVFMCYSSRYLKELIVLTFEDVIIDPKDSQKIRITGIRAKTKINFENIVFPGVQMKIFDKYHPVKKGKLFPQVTELLGKSPHKKFIYTLHQLTKMIGIEADFIPGDKIGRSTFISLIGRDFGSFVGKIMLGHAKESMQNVYLSEKYNLFELTEGRI
jgi:site-specific recombinase XerD